MKTEDKIEMQKAKLASYQPITPASMGVPPRKGNDEWLTDEDVPDSPDILDVPVGWRVVVRPLMPERQSKGGIIYSQITVANAALTETVGKLVAVGALAWKGEIYQGIAWANVGDTVMFGKYAGKKFEYGGVKYVLLNEDEIIARVPDPAKLSR